MKYYVRNKLVSIGGSSEVLDENGKEIYKVKGRAFSPTKVKTIFNLEGHMLYKIRNKFWRINFFRGPKVLIYDAQKNLIANFKNTKFFGVNYVLESQSGQYNLKSNGMFKGYSVFRNGEIIGQLNGKVESVRDLFVDSYEIETNEEGDSAFLVALVLALDNYKDEIKEK